MAHTDLGFQRLAEIYGIRLVQPLGSRSRLGATRQREVVDGHERLTWPARYRPADTFRGHVEFGLKYERLHLEFFSRLFAVLDPQELVDWLKDEPTGRYARRTAFLYEWLTGQRLDAPDTAANVGYVDAIDSGLYLTAQQPERVRRWRINDNLPGQPDFCPMVYLGPPSERGWLYDVAEGVRRLDDTFGPELLLRSAAWLTFKESRASFAIEREADQDERVRRFAAAIGEFSGRLEDPLSPEHLLVLQKAVLGHNALRLGIRRSPVFVGESTFREQIVHYIAPSQEHVLGMLDALRRYELRTRGGYSVPRIAALSFALVYLHPLSDGNGRVHRFLVNHLLAADQVVPHNMVVPVSATIAGSAKGRAQYDQVLEVISRPFMQAYADGYRFGPLRQCPDGVESNFEFEQAHDALHVWRYLDLTAHARYLSDLLRQTVEHEMAKEALLLRQHDDARAAIKQWVEMPDQDADRIIRSLHESQWSPSGKLRKALPAIFSQEGALHHLQDKLIAAVREAFEKVP